MVFAVWQQLFLGCVRKRQMAEIMKESREPNDLSPCDKRLGIRKDVDRAISIPFVSDDVEDAAGEFHDSEGVLEAAMRRAWVDEVCQRKLVNVAKALEWP
jgi:hypothetical protein